jgi:hypothetical protein
MSNSLHRTFLSHSRRSSLHSPIWLTDGIISARGKQVKFATNR